MTRRRAGAGVLILAGALILLVALVAATGGDVGIAPVGLVGLVLLAVGLRLLPPTCEGGG
ncbi:hypothetical protein [Micromonospora sp. NPDC000207]|uniref:hypothetical protein n=1 Tax=unclassified Micromonospora TaxID=2617518 RepID=UPI00331F0455